MSKKSNPEKGLRTVSIEFGGRTRQLKFGHTILGDFEAEANQVLRSQGVIGRGDMIFADTLMSTWLGNAKIFSNALLHGLKHESTKEDPITIETIDAAIDDYLEAGKPKIDLTRAIIRAHKLATDPSSLASLERNWKISDDRQTFLTKAQNEFMDNQEKIIADAKAKATLGSPSTDLPS